MGEVIVLVARTQHPGVGIGGECDVDWLRSQAVAFARLTVAPASDALRNDNFRVGQIDLRHHGRGVRRRESDSSVHTLAYF